VAALFQGHSASTGGNLFTHLLREPPRIAEKSPTAKEDAFRSGRVGALTQHAGAVSSGEVGLAGSFRILIIDDDLGVREYLSALLSRYGHAVFTAPSGEEALEGLTESRPDLVTLDVVLEGMDGIETLRRLKKRLPDVPVVMISGHGHARTIVEAMQLGASDFLRKPFEVEELQPSRRRSKRARCARKSRSCAFR
jgi:CheY-like chemotaxis protein